MTKKIAVTGARGFIGSRFVELYGEQPKVSLTLLASANARHSFFNYALDDYRSIDRALKNVDVLVHCAFDHSYRVNRVGMKNILRACQVNNVKRLVHLSTVSVYEPRAEGVLKESTSYSVLNDPYSREKRAIEQIIDSFDSTFEVVILQPTIVYGLGGNWTRTFFNAGLHKRIALPDGGQCQCNAVYVDDVAMVIHKACNQSLTDRRVKCLISNDELVTWFDLYDRHARLLGELNGLDERPEIVSTTEKTFHDRALVNFIFTLCVKTFLGCLFNLVVPLLQQLISRWRGRQSSTEAVHYPMQKGLIDGTVSPSGMSRLVHRAKFSVDISKARSLLDFGPAYFLDEGIGAIRGKLSGQSQTGRS